MSFLPKYDDLYSDDSLHGGRAKFTADEIAAKIATLDIDDIDDLEDRTTPLPVHPSAAPECQDPAPVRLAWRENRNRNLTAPYRRGTLSIRTDNTLDGEQHAALSFYVGNYYGDDCIVQAKEAAAELVRNGIPPAKT